MHVPMCCMCGVSEVDGWYANSSGEGFCSVGCEQDYFNDLDIARRRYEAPAVTEAVEYSYLENYYESQYEGYDEV